MPSQVRKTKLAEQISIDKDRLDNLSQSLQTFEFEVHSGEVPNEILLFKPPDLRVSNSRFKQLFKELKGAFLGPQIKEYLQTVDIGFPIAKLKKDDAINLVLREVWKVEVAEEIAAEMDVITQKEIAFRQMDLFFMMAEGWDTNESFQFSTAGQMLQNLATRNRTRIIINSQTNTVSLKGTKVSIERVEASLKEISHQIVDARLDLSPLIRVGKFNENYIAGISRLTTVFMDRVDDNMIALYATKPWGRSSIPDAKRLIYTSFDLHFRETYSLLSETQATESLTGALYPVSEDPRLPWVYRGRGWYRWRSIRQPVRWFQESDGILQNDQGTSISTPLVNPVLGANVNYDGIRLLLDSPPGLDATVPATTAPEDADRYTTYHAVLGQILHTSSTPPTRGAQSLSSFLSTEPTHILCHSVPRLVDFLSTLNPTTYTYDFRILLKFSPSPWGNPTNFELLPQVEMEILINPQTNEIKALKIGAIENITTTDVLMPRNNVDLRFVKRTMVRIENRTDQVRNYIREADLDVMGEERLMAGEELVLQIPKWMVKDTAREEKWVVDDEEGVKAEMVESEFDYLLGESEDTGIPQEPEGPKSTIPITYYFTGLQTRSSTTFDFNGSPLVYTKVEGGASGGSHEELVLECTKEEIEYLTPLEEQQLGYEEEIEEGLEAERELRRREEEDEKMLDLEQRKREYMEDMREPTFRTEDVEVWKRTEETDLVEEEEPSESEHEDLELLQDTWVPGEGEGGRGLTSPGAETEALEPAVESAAEPAADSMAELGLDPPHPQSVEASQELLSEEAAATEDQEVEGIKEEEEEETAEENTDPNYISDEVFQRFVSTARKLVEAVEHVDMIKNKWRKL
ncbi:hypothetical protein ABW19_dt0200203 [Dactylella cylindrospora]|nr:hypothetical protein ABW19_dt0200203 [Dactylella cylindrospora]